MKKFLVSILSVIVLVSSTMPLSLPVAAAVQTAPSGLTATAASASQVNLAWADNSDNETSFRIERSLDNFATAPSANLTASANAISLSDTTVAQPNTYYYRVIAVNGTDDSAPSNVATVKVDVPSAPSDLSATIMNATRVDLIWTDRSSDETGFRIERSLDGFATAPSATFNVAANVRTLTDSTVSANNTYSYRVIAVNALGSTASNIATVIVNNKIQAGPIDPAFIFNGDPNTSFPGYYQDDQGTRVALLPGAPGQAIDPPDPNNPYQVFLGMGEEAFYWLAESSIADMDGAGPGGKLVTVFATEANVVGPGTEVVFARIRIFAKVPAPGTYLFQHPWGEDTIDVTQEDVDANRGIRLTEDIGLSERNFSLVGNSRINRFLRQTVPPPPAGWIGDGVSAGPVTGSPIGFNKIRLTAPAGVNLDGAGHNFVESTTFTVAARLQTGVAPVPSFNTSLNPANGIAPVTANFTDTSSNSPTGWLWNFGDGATSTARNPGHVYNSAGSYTVTLTATNAAGSASTSQTVNVYSPPTASFMHAVPNGLPPVSVSFTDNSTGNIAFWSWDFGDGGASALRNPSHTYAAAGVYTVNLTVRNPAGIASVSHGIRISANLVASFTTSASPASGIAPVTANFTDASTGNITAWLWDFGDGATTTTQNAAKTYNAAGDYKVTLTITDAAGEAATSQTVSVYSLPAASFTKSTARGVPPLNVSFADTSTGNPASRKWNFGDGATSALQNPTHIYSVPGEYNIVLMVMNPAGVSFTSQTVIVTGLRPEFPLKLQVGPIDQNFIFQGDPNTSFPTYYQDDQGTRVALLPGAPGQIIDPPDPNNPYQVFLGMGEEAFYYLAESGIADMDGAGPGGKLVTVFAVEANVVGPGSEVVFTRVRIIAKVPTPGAYVFQHPYGTENFDVTQDDIDGGRGIFFTRDLGLAERDFFQAAGGDFTRFLHQTVPPPPAGLIGDGVSVGPVTGSPTGFNKVRLTGPAGVNLDGAGNNFVESNQFTVSARVLPSIVPTLAAPTGLRATVPAGTQTVNLVWTDNSANETGFRIERSADNFATPPSFSANVTANVTAFADTIAGAAYYRVIAVNALGDSMASNVVPVIIVPAAPTALTAAIVSATRVDLVWTDNANDETGFRIQRSANGGAFVVVGSTQANITAFSDLTVVINNTYDYRVVAFNAGGDSPPSNVVQVVVVVPAAPSSLGATVVSDTQVDLTWVDNATNELSFRIERATNGGAFVGIGSVQANVTAFNDTGAPASARLSYRVFAVNNVGDSLPSNVVEVTKGPLRPASLAATRVEFNRVDLSWVDNSADEAGFRIERATNNGFSTGLVTVTVGVNRRDFSDRTVTANTTFYYRVFAFNGNGDSAPAGPVSVTTPLGGGGAIIVTLPPAPVTLTGVTGTPPRLDNRGKTVDSVRLSTSDGKATINVPSGTQMTDRAGQPITTLTAAPLVTPPAPPPQATIVLAYTFGPAGAQFNPPIDMILSFNPATLPPGTQINKLQVAWWDGTKWVKLSSAVDQITNTITAQVAHFTEFAIIAEVEPQVAVSQPSPAPAVAPASPAPVPTPAPLPSPAPSIIPAPAPQAPPVAAPPSPSSPAPAPAPATEPGFNWDLAIGLVVGTVLLALMVVLWRRRAAG